MQLFVTKRKMKMNRDKKKTTAIKASSLLKNQPARQSMDGLPKLRRLKAKQFERLGRIHFGQAAAEKVPDGLFQQYVWKEQ